MSKIQLVIFGCGGHARSIINTVREADDTVEILVVDNNVGDDESILGCPTKKIYELTENDKYILGIGDNAKRAELFRSFSQRNMGECVSIISVSAHIGLHARVGCGTYVGVGAFVGPEVTIGNNTIINTESVIEHEVTIGDHTHIAPNVTVCGRTQIGNHVFCGTGSTVIDSVRICSNVVIGAGAVVTSDIVNAGTYVGIPAKKIS